MTGHPNEGVVVPLLVIVEVGALLQGDASKFLHRDQGLPLIAVHLSVVLGRGRLIAEVEVEAEQEADQASRLADRLSILL